MEAALDARSTAGPNPNILVTLGSQGLLLLSRNPQCPRQRSLSPADPQEPHPSTPGRWQAWWYPPLDTEVADANGAGDAFLAGFTAAFTAEPSDSITVADAIAWGQAAAAITLESQHTVAAELSRAAVSRRLAE